MAKVPFEKDAVAKCICPQCPVQTKSKCAQDLKPKLEEALSHSPLRREEIPGLYCATGKAACPDLDTGQSCICGDCPVFARYKLAAAKPAMYYCKDGSAH